MLRGILRIPVLEQRRFWNSRVRIRYRVGISSSRKVRMRRSGGRRLRCLLWRSWNRNSGLWKSKMKEYWISGGLTKFWKIFCRGGRGGRLTLQNHQGCNKYRMKSKLEEGVVQGKTLAITRLFTKRCSSPPPRKGSEKSEIQLPRQFCLKSSRSRKHCKRTIWKIKNLRPPTFLIFQT